MKLNFYAATCEKSNTLLSMMLGHRSPDKEVVDLHISSKMEQDEGTLFVVPHTVF